MESLFALYNPLWLCNSTGKGSSLFYNLVLHFGSRTTFNLTKIGRIRTVLTNGQLKLFKICNKKHQANFQPGAFASCDFFLELLLDPKRNQTKALNGLFELVEHREFMCESAKPCLEQQTQSLTTIKIERSMFQANNVAEADVLGLIDVWTTTGLSKSPRLVCRCDSILGTTEKIPKARGRPSKKVKNVDLKPEVTVVSNTQNNPNHPVVYIQEKSQLAFKDELPPQHLYFFVEVTPITNTIEQQEYMRIFELAVPTEDCGTTGVWLHDDQQNEGIARLVNTDASSIGGCHPFTSWIFYSRRWTAAEEKYVQESIAKISNDHPNAKGNTPFVHLGKLINPQVESVPVIKYSEPLDGGKYVDNYEDLEASDLDYNSDNSSEANSESNDEDASKNVVSHPTKPLANKSIKLKLKLNPSSHPVQETSQKVDTNPAGQPKSLDANAAPVDEANQPQSTQRSKRTFSSRK
ncbi:hypothetical protein PTTG_06780 [Puccinia triticina 1-1 BBBD Race 1]|uniref:Uncharacterized protein n=1 Tax=Puccinia triticina (isolate 1-1 / race 1 (BBBD)) TaxID=630390 RepID=A0A180GLQ3_PUCT1|nr:hypothetical protein PTTG_06780 [Puccinia triticina 1-1 BBBD Race 1]